jgi:hypothetical protein
MHDRTEFTPEKWAWAAAVAVLTAVVWYALLYVRLALPELARPLAVGEGWRLRLVPAMTAAGGGLGAVLGAWRFRLIRFQPSLGIACRACGAAAALALMSLSWSIALLAALATGIALGWASVILLSGLRGCVGTGGLGRAIGAGVGLGFALAHLPMLDAAHPRTQTIVVALAILAVSVLTPFLTPQEPSLSLRPEYQRPGLIRWSVVLLTLTVLAAAYPLSMPQATAPHSGSWPMVFLPGLAAGIGGWWIDRGRRGALTLVGAAALVLLTLAWWSMTGPLLGESLAALGAGLGALALLYLPARGARPWQAALILIGGGWLGATAGTLLQQASAVLPTAVVVTLALLSLSALVTQWREDW